MPVLAKYYICIYREKKKSDFKATKKSKMIDTHKTVFEVNQKKMNKNKEI